MTKLTRVYRSQIGATLLMLLQYRVAILIQPIGEVVRPLIFLAVWRTIAEAQGGSVDGYTPEAFAAYYILAMLVQHIQFAWDVESISRPIQTGALSPQLMRPLHPVHMRIGEIIAYKIMSFPTVILGMVIAALAFHPSLTFKPLYVLLAVPVLCLAFALNFMISWTVGICAFWTTRIDAVGNILWLMMLFLAGQVVPLALLPSDIGTIAKILPYSWTFAFPIDVLGGNLSVAEVLGGMTVQAAWLLAVLLIHHQIWRAGIKRYASVGG